MRLLVTRTDEDGRSSASHDREVDLSMIAYPVTEQLAETDGVPPSAPAVAGGDFMALSPPAGIVQWRLARFPPGHAVGDHYTESWDFHIVVRGALVLGLDDGDHPLAAGDCALVTGVRHRWTVGADGASLLMARVGTTPRP